MPGKTPHEAVRNFVDPLHLSLMCLVQHTECHPKHMGGAEALGANRTLTFNGGKPMWCETGGAEPDRYGLIATIGYRIISDPRPNMGPIRVTTLEYGYDIVIPKQGDPAGTSLLSWHWHPDVPNVPQPHMHLEKGVSAQMHDALHKAHVPTGRVALEDVIEFMIVDLEVEPTCSDWREILHDAREAHVAHRSWHSRPPDP